MGNLRLSCSDAIENISEEVIELIKICRKSTKMFSKFISINHEKECFVANHGYTKLIEMFEVMSSQVQVLWREFRRVLKSTLSHRVQMRCFSFYLWLRGKRGNSTSSDHFMKLFSFIRRHAGGTEAAFALEQSAEPRLDLRPYKHA
jgi:hypothetical protein